MIRTIYLDLDDVCNTLAPSVLHFMGCKIQPDSYEHYPGEFGYAAHVAVNHLLGTHYVQDAFWKSLPQTLWATIPRTSFFHWLIEKSRLLVGEENVFLATKPILTPACAAGKMEWIQEFCPPWLANQFSITTHKERSAQPGTLLIDDYGLNILKFTKRGGNTILVPRPWNNLRGLDPQSHIALCLQYLQFGGTRQ